MNQDEMKLSAAKYALNTFVTSGMFLGLGSGSTAEIFLATLAEYHNSGRLSDITCVATSEKVAGLARGYGLKVLELDEVQGLDLTVDGADEIDPKTFYVTKGRGAAHLREKLVAISSKMEIIIADESKLVEALGQKMPVPVEVIPFSWKHTEVRLRTLGCTPILRLTGGKPHLTDSQNYILDCSFPPIAAPGQLALDIKNQVGVVEHGLFIDLVSRVVIAGPEGAYELPVPA